MKIKIKAHGGYYSPSGKFLVSCIKILRNNINGLSLKEAKDILEMAERSFVEIDVSKCSSEEIRAIKNDLSFYMTVFEDEDTIVKIRNLAVECLNENKFGLSIDLIKVIEKYSGDRDV